MYEPAEAGVAVLEPRPRPRHQLPRHRGRLRRRRERDAASGLVMKTRAQGRLPRHQDPGARPHSRRGPAEVEASLKRLQTDHVDLLHVHSLGDADDLAKIEAPDGVLKALYELREQKVARFIGMTSHTDGAVMAKAIERNDLDCVQMAMNPARANRFEELALPAAKQEEPRRHPDEGRPPRRSCSARARPRPAALLRYAWSLPVSTAVCGMPKLEHLEANVASARALRADAGPEMDELRGGSPGTRARSSASSPTTTTAASPDATRRARGRRRAAGNGRTCRQRGIRDQGRSGGGTDAANSRPDAAGPRGILGRRCGATAMWAASVPGVPLERQARRRLERGWHRCGRFSAAAEATGPCAADRELRRPSCCPERP